MLSQSGMADSGWCTSPTNLIEKHVIFFLLKSPLRLRIVFSNDRSSLDFKGLKIDKHTIQGMRSKLRDFQRTFKKIVLYEA